MPHSIHVHLRDRKQVGERPSGNLTGPIRPPSPPPHSASQPGWEVGRPGPQHLPKGGVPDREALGRTAVSAGATSGGTEKLLRVCREGDVLGQQLLDVAWDRQRRADHTEVL